ncbi:MAG: protein translocase subunit SecF [Pseudomonadota bacterium]|nr:protein translocase subunit SecF [Pseudomonadota bacterium]
MATQNKAHRWGKIDFMGQAWMFGSASALAVILSLVIFATKRINYGIDFAGGLEVQVKFQKEFSTEQLRSSLAGLGFPKVQIQEFGEKSEFLLRLENPDGANEKEITEKANATAKKLSEVITANLSNMGPNILRTDSVGPQVGEELKKNSILAGFYSLIVLLIYVGLRFDFNFSAGAILCLFHDAIITLGILVLLGKEINVQIMASILTLIGFSVNDTIVTFDRIRENLTHHRDGSLKDIMNLSVNEMLSRTILTTGTVFLSTGALYWFAGGVIEDFAFSFLIGIVIGVYSSIYVASPIALVFERIKR